VTGMILWMSTHSRGLKRELEAQAQEALGDGTSRALVIMAFLAVLKEGFETSVFLLATFQASTNAFTAATGAFLGILVAIGLGIGIYRGGVRINLSRFFRATGVFLVLVAAGLLVTALRTAHEAGWLNAGQQRTVDLSWLAPVGSIRGALFTGVLGIPADPRLVEVVGWLCYLVPMMLIVLWPPTRRPGPVASIRIKQVVALAAVVAAGLLAVLVRAPALPASGPAPLVDATGASVGTAQLRDGSRLETTVGTTTATYALSRAGEQVHDGTTAEHLTGSAPTPADLPTTLTLDDLVAVGGGRVPVGVDVQRNPGPYTAAWSGTGALDAWSVEGVLLDATSRHTLVLTLTGGGLPTSRTLTVTPDATLPGGAGTAPASWTVAPDHVDAAAHAARTHENQRTEARFWGRFVPLVLLAAAAALLLTAERRRRALTPPPSTALEDRGSSTTPNPRSNAHAG
ncbi:FTR1 family iron permease, partial [Nostocoides japonicum]